MTSPLTDQYEKFFKWKYGMKVRFLEDPKDPMLDIVKATRKDGKKLVIDDAKTWIEIFSRLEVFAKEMRHRELPKN
jgi:hypothetical protein